MKDEFDAYSIGDLGKIAESLIAKYPKNRIFALHGAMGAGKTTLMKAVCGCLQSKDEVTSPTFSIVNQYELPSGKQLFHFDFYRIKNIEEAIDIGFEEYLYSGNYCFIEWAQNVEILLPPDTVEVQIEVKNNRRVFRF